MMEFLSGIAGELVLAATVLTAIATISKMAKSLKAFITRSTSGKIDALSAELAVVRKDAELGNARLELLHLLDHNPNSKNAIYVAIDRYHALGGNSYVDSMIEDWKTNMKQMKGVGHDEAHT